ncbi:MAG: hypothetical protein RLZZ385_2335 [Pseudomonadota bacterium]
MNQNTKQRIVGTLVLLAVALIFLPIIFDGEGSYQRPVSSRIPEPPVIAPMAQANPSRPILENPPPPVAAPLEDVVPDDVVDGVVIEPDIVSLDNDVAAAPEPAAARLAVEDPVEPTATVEPAGVAEPVLQLDAQGLPQGWSVRLGSFSDGRNAQALLQRLLDKGYKAYTRQIVTQQGELTAVFVGPQLDRGAVDELRARLRDEFQLNGMVVRFEVESL